MQGDGHKETALDDIKIICNSYGFDYVVDPSIDRLFGLVPDA